MPRLQDTMLAGWRGAASFRGESSVRSWLIAIARRQARDRRLPGTDQRHPAPGQDRSRAARCGHHHRLYQLTTSAATRVDTLVTSGVDQLREGVLVTVVGRPNAGGTLAASAVEQGADLPDIKMTSKRSATGTCDAAAIAGVIALGG